ARNRATAPSARPGAPALRGRKKRPALREQRRRCAPVAGKYRRGFSHLPRRQSFARRLRPPHPARIHRYYAPAAAEPQPEQSARPFFDSLDATGRRDPVLYSAAVSAAGYLAGLCQRRASGPGAGGAAPVCLPRSGAAQAAARRPPHGAAAAGGGGIGDHHWFPQLVPRRAAAGHRGGAHRVSSRVQHRPHDYCIPAAGRRHDALCQAVFGGYS
nr:hypothetical protein [Tanacetum cinerariifolium]